MENLILYEKESILNNLTLNKELFSLVELKIFESIPSTNDYLKNLSWQNKVMICLAEEQTKGRGRFSRNWYSPYGQNIYLSIGFYLNKKINELTIISLIISLAVIEAIKEYGIKEEFLIKWPNDVLWHGEKIAGILIDVDPEINGHCKLIIGVGMNLDMSKKQDINLQTWMSLKEITGYTIDKNKMVALLINNIVTYTKEFERSGPFYFLEQWNKYDYLYGKSIKIKVANTEEQGVSQGIDQTGRLLLQLNNGYIKAFACGDATLSL